MLLESPLQAPPRFWSSSIARALALVALSLVCSLSYVQAQVDGVITEVDGERVVVRVSADAAARAGDEFAILRESVRSGGELETVESGLIVAEAVEDGFVSGLLRFASPPPRPGEQVRRLRRDGVELSAAFEVHTDGIFIVNLPRLTAAFRPGWFPWRPLASVELPVHGRPDLRFLHANLVAGGEWSSFVGRIRLSPSLVGGLGLALPLVDDPDLAPLYLGHLGVLARASGSLLISRGLEVSVRVGYGFWYGLHENAVPPQYRELASYHGLLVGAGITFR